MCWHVVKAWQSDGVRLRSAVFDDQPVAATTCPSSVEEAAKPEDCLVRRATAANDGPCAVSGSVVKERPYWSRIPCNLCLIARPRSPSSNRITGNVLFLIFFFNFFYVSATFFFTTIPRHRIIGTSRERSAGSTRQTYIGQAIHTGYTSC